VTPYYCPPVDANVIELLQSAIYTISIVVDPGLLATGATKSITKDTAICMYSVLTTTAS
jgi:hypothetical protein